MSLTTRLDEMRDAVRYTADIVAFTDKHPNARINVLINQGLGALSRLCRTTNPLFQPISSVTLTMDGDNTMYALPATFRSLLTVEYTGDEHKTWLTPHEPSERPMLTDADSVANARRGTSYRLVGTNLEILPLPPEDHTVLVWFASTVTQLATDSSLFDTMERLDTYVIWWAAREIAMEREAWERHDRLSQKLVELEGDIRILARSLDLSHPARIVDLDRTDKSGRRYR